MTFKEWVKKRWRGTTEELAREIGLTRMQLWRYMTGRVKNPPYITVKKIEALTHGEVKVEDLVVLRNTPAGAH